MGTVHGEDLPYIFGAPLVNSLSHFPRNFTKSESSLSETIILFWTNFAKTGDPNDPRTENENSNNEKAKGKSEEFRGQNIMTLIRNTYLSVMENLSLFSVVNLILNGLFL
ncbi:hypothetical protein CEXT_133031 [Caerostris extrusa]|uniref:Carboxylesterase type B domain-containing protein n=1 Tax=Caerostris extrusa TaxID=172846 RepID=A0AAV4U3J8_CAEEX|nr:hypothetical protein CEXT_133031 [Caerostris extrusa]